MQIHWSTAVTAGIISSLAIVVFMIIIPRIVGVGPVDIIHDMGVAFSTQSPHLAGMFFITLMGIFWAALFAVLYSMLPGNYMSKGIVFGLLVGLFSLSVLPNIMSSLDNMIGSPNQYVVIPFQMNTQTMTTIAAYIVFGLAMAWSYRPTGRNTPV